MSVYTSAASLMMVITVCVSERRQTMLFSATQTRKIEDLARVSLKKEPLYIGVDDKKEAATVDGLEQVRIFYAVKYVYISFVECIYYGIIVGKDCQI